MRLNEFEILRSGRERYPLVQGQRQCPPDLSLKKSVYRRDLLERSLPQAVGADRVDRCKCAIIVVPSEARKVS